MNGSQSTRKSEDPRDPGRFMVLDHVVPQITRLDERRSPGIRLLWRMLDDDG